MMKRHWILLSTLGVLALVGLRLGISAEKPTLTTSTAFTLIDPREKKSVSLTDFKDKKAIVLLFTGTECPINNSYLITLGKLHEEYRDKGVQFLAINSNSQDSASRVAEHARANEVPFPVLKDEGNRVADQLGAKRTPEALVLDAERVVRYRGRIDDQFGVGFQRAKPSRRDLAVALDEVLAGKAVSQESLPVAGCLIGRAVKAKADGSVTFNNQVVRILQKNCQECHHANAIGPMALMSYDDTAAWSAMIREVLQENRMPPWHADSRYGKFANDRSMSKADRETLLAWIDQDCPQGAGKDLPPAKEFVNGWNIGKPDLILTLPEPFQVPAETPKGGIPYQHIRVKTNFTEDRWVQSAEAKPDALPVVHHIVVFIVPPGLKFKPKEGNAPVLCGTAPGDMPLMLEPGMAKKIPAGSELIFQMHYTPMGKAMKDRSTVGMIFAKEPPKQEVYSIANGNPIFLIPPGDDNFEVESDFTFPYGGKVLSFMPHMHLRGKDFRYEAVTADGKREILLSVPKYQFGWQSVYRCQEPLKIVQGTKIHCVAHFDNSAKNPNNPDPNREVRWGDQTWEEMMIGWMDIVFELPAR